MIVPRSRLDNSICCVLAADKISKVCNRLTGQRKLTFSTMLEFSRAPWQPVATKINRQEGMRVLSVISYVLPSTSCELYNALGFDGEELILPSIGADHRRVTCRGNLFHTVLGILVTDRCVVIMVAPVLREAGALRFINGFPWINNNIYSIRDSHINGNNGSYTNSDDVEWFDRPVLRRQQTVGWGAVDDDTEVLGYPRMCASDRLLVEELSVRVDDLESEIYSYDSTMSRFRADLEAIEPIIVEIHSSRNKPNLFVCCLIACNALILMYVLIYNSYYGSQICGNNGSWTNSDDLAELGLKVSLSGSNGKGGTHAANKKIESKNSNSSSGQHKKKGGYVEERLCNDFWSSRGCSRSKCKFSHERSSSKCNSFVGGKCKYGDKCKYSHDTDNQSEQVSEPVPEKKEGGGGGGEKQKEVILELEPEFEVMKLYFRFFEYSDKRFYVLPFSDKWNMGFVQYEEVTVDMNLFRPLYIKLSSHNPQGKMIESSTYEFMATKFFQANGYHEKISKENMMDMDDLEPLRLLPSLVQQKILFNRYEQNKSLSIIVQRPPFGCLNALALLSFILGCFCLKMMTIPGSLTLWTMDYFWPRMRLPGMPWNPATSVCNRTGELLWVISILIAPFGMLSGTTGGLYALLSVHWVLLCFDYSMTKSALLGYMLYSLFGYKILFLGISMSKCLVALIVCYPIVIGSSILGLRLIRSTQNRNSVLTPIYDWLRRGGLIALMTLLIVSLRELILRCWNLLRRTWRNLRVQLQIYQQLPQYELDGLWIV